MHVSMKCPDLVSLELLRSTVELGSISAAAKEFGLTQPSASERLRLLERKLGVPLLRRSRSGSHPEPAALVLLDDIGALLNSAVRLVEHARTLSDSDESTLSLGASFTIAEYFLPDQVPRWCGGAAGRSVKLLIRNSTGIEAAVRDGSVQMGLVEGPTVDPDFDTSVIAEDRLILVVAQTHPWSRVEDALLPEQLGDGRLVAREAGSGTRAVFEMAMANAGAPIPTYVSELGSTTAVKSAVLAGRYATVVSARAVAEELERDLLVEVPLRLDLKRSFWTIWPAGRTLSRPCRSFLELISEPLTLS